MQSFRQYRQFRGIIEKQLEKHRAEEGASAGAKNENSAGYSHDALGDPEKKAADPAASLAGRVTQRFDVPHSRGRRSSSRNKAHSRGRGQPPTAQPGLEEEQESSRDEQEELEEKEEVEEPSVDDDTDKAIAVALDHADPEKKVVPIRQAPTRSSSHGSRSSSRARQTLSRMSTRTNATIGAALGTRLTGVDARDRTTNEGGDRSKQVFVVGWHDEHDPMNPHNWSKVKRIRSTLNVASIGAVVGFASSIDSSALTQASEEFGVSPVVESLATGLYLAGFGAGALFAGPVSETLGRNPVYITTLSLYMIFIMASGLAPNIGAQLAFRFLAGFFGSTPLTCAGGSVADLWSPLERVWAFPVFANAAFMGPVIGPVVGGFIAESSLVSWRWTEWITLIISGLVLTSVTLFQPETYSGIILQWKAQHLRNLTGDDRFAGPMEIRAETFFDRLRRALYRPFLLTAQEPIIILITLYLTVIYIILFTFLDGYDYIFGQIHGTSLGITGLCFLGIAIGLCFASALVPLIYKWAKRDLKKIHEEGGANLPPEFRLWFAMLGGAVAIPVSLFWMAWTSYPQISIWSPLVASIFFGYGILCVFISSYQYVIDSYEIYSASALASVTLIRYIASGAMVVVGIPFYENLGVHYTVTILGCIAALMVPVPYVFFKYGPKIRAKSKYAVTEKP